MGYVDSAYWLDLGTPAAFVQGSCDLGAWHRTLACIARTRSATRWCSATRASRRPPLLSGGTCVSPGAVVEADAVVDGSVVFDDAVIEAGARVRASVIGRGARIGAGSVLDGVVIGDGAVIGCWQRIADRRAGVAGGRARAWVGALLERRVSVSTAMLPLQRRYVPSAPLDLGATLGPHVRGRYDPCHRVVGGVHWRTWRTPMGPATVRLSADAGAGCVDAVAWGAGADWALDGVPALLGDGRRCGRVRAARRGRLRDVHRRLSGMRLSRSGRVFEALVPAILEQLVTEHRSVAVLEPVARGLR